MQNPNQARHNSKKTSRIFGGYDNEISCKMPVFPGKPFLLPFFVSTAAGKKPACIRPYIRPCIRRQNGLS
jgi:hypothetical protein